MGIILGVGFSVTLLLSVVVLLARRSLAAEDRGRGRRGGRAARASRDSTVDVDNSIVLLGVDGSLRHSDVFRSDAGGGGDAGSAHGGAGSWSSGSEGCSSSSDAGSGSCSDGGGGGGDGGGGGGD